MEQTSARVWGQERPSGSHPLRPQLDRPTQMQGTFAFADSRECNGFSTVHYTAFSRVLLHGCGFSHDYLSNCERRSQHLIDCSEESRRYLRTVQEMQSKRLYCSIHLASACIGPRRAPINH